MIFIFPAVQLNSLIVHVFTGLAKVVDWKKTNFPLKSIYSYRVT